MCHFEERITKTDTQGIYQEKMNMNIGRKSDFIRFQNLYFSRFMSIITGKLLKEYYEQVDHQVQILVWFSYDSSSESKISIMFSPWKTEKWGELKKATIISNPADFFLPNMRAILKGHKV